MRPNSSKKKLHGVNKKFYAVKRIGVEKRRNAVKKKKKSNVGRRRKSVN